MIYKTDKIHPTFQSVSIRDISIYGYSHSFFVSVREIEKFSSKVVKRCVISSERQSGTTDNSQ